MSDHSGLSSTGLLLDRVSQSPSYPCCFLLVIFHPLPARHLLCYKFPLAHAVFELEPNLSPSLQNLITVLPYLPWWLRDKVWIKSALRFLTSVMEFVSLTSFGVVTWIGSESPLELSPRTPEHNFEALIFTADWLIRDPLENLTPEPALQTDVCWSW